VKKAPRKFPKKKVANRTSLLLLIVLIAGIIITVAFFQFPTILKQHAQVATKPNIIVIMTDDQPYDTMTSLPTVTGRLANNGMTFTNAHLVTPLCCPSRSSFLTGLYAHNTGVWLNSDGFRQFKKKEDRTIGVWVKNAGYRTGIFGKLMNNYNNGGHVSPGWDDWFVSVGSQHYFGQKMSDNGREVGYPNSAYFNDVITSRAVNFVRDAKEPFFMVYTPNIPHFAGDEGDGSDELSGPLVPAGFAEASCTDIPAWNPPPNFNEADVSDKPAWVRQLNGPSLSRAQKFRKDQLCALKLVNASIDKIIAAVGEARMQNTVIIYYTDNGYSTGEHRYVKKNCLYEECARTPLVISSPALFSERKTNDSVVSHIDITATIADLAGAVIPVKINGKSLLPILRGDTDSVRDAVLIEVKAQNKTVTGAAVRTKEYKYTKYNTGEREFYDEINDPYELQNQINNPAYQSIISDLSAKLTSLKAE
jgi:N-acetylglucosamine-6-sulfatase